MNEYERIAAEIEAERYSDAEEYALAGDSSGKAWNLALELAAGKVRDADRTRSQAVTHDGGAE